MKNSNDTSWDRTSDLQICSIAPYPLCYRGTPLYPSTMTQMINGNVPHVLPIAGQEIKMYGHLENSDYKDCGRQNHLATNCFIPNNKVLLTSSPWLVWLARKISRELFPLKFHDLKIQQKLPPTPTHRQQSQNVGTTLSDRSEKCIHQ